MASFKLVVAAFVMALVAGNSAIADVKLPAVIGDNMVIQQGMAFKVWGWADAGEKIIVSIGSLKGEATADDKGNWLVKLDALKASAEPMEMTVAGKNTITVKNILVGEVWLCSGQSNMEWAVSQVNDGQKEIANADHPTIRLFNVSPTKHTAKEPEADVKASWQVCSPKTVERFSGVGYFFGRHLMDNMKVPVGLINASWGGSPVQQWIPMTTYRSDPDLSGYPPNIDKAIERFPAQVDAYPQQLAAWKATTQQAIATRPAAATQPNMLPRQPHAPKHPLENFGGMYNGNIAPLTNYAIKGVIWYQGESNAGDAADYRKTFPAMIRGWRNVWGQGDFPFLYVQLTSYGHVATDPNISGGWPQLRDAQTMTLSTPNTGMAVIIDVGEARDIHPRDKQTVGYRLGLIAQAIAYGMKDVPFSGPVFDSIKIEGSNLRVNFKNAHKGLVAKGESLRGFAIAGADGKYAWAQATIDGDSVVLTSDQIKEPVMVRYGWQNVTDCNLYDGAGLPASPFRAGEPEAGSK